jgi:UDP-N-acetylmuramoyl-tripeptide--D-alanyl-D-alanine ligase
MAMAARAGDESLMTWTGEEIARAVGAAAPAGARSASAVCTDTRKLAPDCLYVALRGATHDGHAFAADALARGAALALVDHLPAGVDAARALVVPDTLRALGDLAAWTRRRWGGRVVAITGSNGNHHQGDARGHPRAGLAAAC